VESFFPEVPGLIVGAAGRLSREKGFDVFLDSAIRICARRTDVGFVLFGDGPMRPALQQKIAEHGLQQRFILGGFRTDVEKLLPGLDLAVLSSHTEGLPVAVLEAQAAGVPVVATAVGGTPEVILEGVTGWLVRPANPTVLAESITFALDNESQRRSMGRAGRQRVRDEFTFKAQAEQYQQLFDRLLSRVVTRSAEERRKCCHA
jgi:glycosyltransferase involved in cell wall biosynthesis